jgi:para-nitrobenzyl esterase
VRPLAEQELIGEELARAAGCAGPNAPACLRALGVNRIISALPGIPGPLVASEHNPNIDGWLLEEAPLLTMARGAHNPVPIIVSTNEDEVGGAIAPAVSAAQYPVLVRTLFGAELVPELLARYPPGANPRDDLVRMITDARYVCPARRTARAAAAGGSRVFRAVFAHALSRGAEAELGAYHGLELQFLFRTFERVGYRPTERELKLSDRMISRYAAFAAGGDPNDGETPPWPLDAPDAERHLRFDDPLSIGDEASRDCDFWDALPSASPAEG